MKKLLLLAAVALVGCAAPKTWSKDGSTERDFNMESNQCRAQAYSVPFAPPLRQTVIFEACMQGKGWTPEP